MVDNVKKYPKIRLKGKERLSLFSDLSTMLTAGIPILEAVVSLEEDATSNMKKVLKVLHETLNNGEPLSRGLSRMPNAFDQISVNLIRAAEAGGTLEETLHDIVQTTKKELAFADQLRNTMIYPLFVMGVFLAIVVLMLTFVIPRVAKVFTAMKVHMPFITKVMISTSNTFTQHWLVITVAFFAFVLLLAGIIKANSRAIARTLLSLPGLKKLGTNIDLTRFTRSFGLLMHAGVPVLEALSLSKKVVRKKNIIAVIDHMTTNVENGKPLSTGLRAKRGVIPPIMSRSIETAEESGTLEQTMQNLTEYFDDQVAGSIKVVSSLVEPVLLVLVGGMVGTLMITIIAPIYNLISQINPKS
ncbi:MAG TPA: type II secretion system F family protein [Candidatus Microsaccharimonas sp.]|nr:type II secretion system F family protein [Candidatus Microsaccharimonas sp.]